MKRFKLSDSGARGWFIGDFESAVLRTKEFEVGYQHIPCSKPATHIHKQITEITLIISGRAIVNGELFKAGDIHVLYPNDISQIEYLEDTKVVTIKTPSIPEDKYYL
jgi:hypothetical protein